MFGPVKRPPKWRLPRGKFVAEAEIEYDWTDHDKFHHAAIQSFPEDLLGFRQAKGFHERVRKHFLDILPEVVVRNVRIERIICGWCRKAASPSATHIDHIIPKATYLRYRLYTSAPDPSISIATRLKRWLHDPENLLVACSQCNIKKGKRLPTHAELHALELGAGTVGNVAAMGAKVALAREITLAYSGLPSNSLSDYLTKGNREVIVDGTSFGGRKELSAGEIEIRGWGFWSSRFPFDPSEVREALEKQQHKSIEQQLTGKLCFYCLGVYERQAFQIDHILPTRGQDLSYVTYNKSGNLFAVCAWCNRCKSSSPLTLQFLFEQIKNRIALGVPGIEKSALRGDMTEADFIKYAFARQRHVFHKKFPKTGVPATLEQQLESWLALSYPAPKIAMEQEPPV